MKQIKRKKAFSYTKKAKKKKANIENDKVGCKTEQKELKYIKKKLNLSKTRVRDTVDRLHHIKMQFLLFWNWILDTRDLGNDLKPTQDIFT